MIRRIFALAAGVVLGVLGRKIVDLYRADPDPQDRAGQLRMCVAFRNRPCGQRCRMLGAIDCGEGR